MNSVLKVLKVVFTLGIPALSDFIKTVAENRRAKRAQEARLKKEKEAAAKEAVAKNDKK